ELASYQVELAMSALGDKRTFRSAIAMSALPPKADITQPRRMSRQLHPAASTQAEVKPSAFAVQAHRHSADRTVDDIALERDGRASPRRTCASAPHRRPSNM